MSKKAAKKAEIAQSRAAAEKSAGSYVIAGIEFFAVGAVISMALSFLISGFADFGTVFTIAGAIVSAMCYSRKMASFSTLVKINIIFGVCAGLFMGAVHVGYMYATNPGFLVAFETQGLDAINLATGFAPFDYLRRLLMHLMYNSKYTFFLNISFAGILDLALSLAAYGLFMFYMVKRLAAKEE